MEKIKVNRVANEQRYSDIVKEIVAQATRFANKGYTTFYFNTSGDKYLGLGRFKINTLVEKATDNSVKCCVGGLQDGRIKYYID